MQKYKIFTTYHYLCITNIEEDLLESDNKEIITLTKSDYPNLDLGDMLEEKQGRKNIILLTTDFEPREAFEKLIGNYKKLRAGGGIVRNKDNQILCIFRNGKWDLPKGHIEEGETEQEAAKREVEEETGIEVSKVQSLANISYHTYILDQTRVIKETYWFYMKSDSNTLLPQKEEGIEKVEWVSKQRLEDIFSITYLNIKDLLSEIEL